jgi:hypothetical protein
MQFLIIKVKLVIPEITMGSHPASGGYKYRGLVLRHGGWAWGYNPTL